MQSTHILQFARAQSHSGSCLFLKTDIKISWHVFHLLNIIEAQVIRAMNAHQIAFKLPQRLLGEIIILHVSSLYKL